LHLYLKPLGVVGAPVALHSISETSFAVHQHDLLLV
jgi:hypothetical protein